MKYLIYIPNKYIIININIYEIFNTYILKPIYYI